MGADRREAGHPADAGRAPFPDHPEPRSKDLGVQIIGNVPDALDPVEMPWEYFSSQQAAVNGNNSSNLRSRPSTTYQPGAGGHQPRRLGQVLDRGRNTASKYVPIIPAVMGRRRGCSQKSWSLPGLQAFTPATYWTENLKG